MKITMTKNAIEATLITHGGIFHADEVFGTVILAKLFGEVTVCRVFKVPDEVPEGVMVYDIGLGEYDHHQKGGNGARENGVPFAACGLIWRKFGPQIVASAVNPALVWNIIDRELIAGIDAIDTGFMPKTEGPARPMSLSQVISSFNPRWDTNDDADEAFLRAVAFAETVFDNVLANACAKAKAEEIVEEAISKSEGRLMILNQFVPWQEYLFKSQNEKAAEIQFVIFPSNRGGYNFQAVPDSLGSFGQRKKVPVEWKGLNGEALQQVTGVRTASFVHPAGFIGGAETLEDTIKLAKLAIDC